MVTRVLLEDTQIQNKLLYAFFLGVVQEDPGTIQDFQNCIEELKNKPYKLPILEAYFRQTGVEVSKKIDSPAPLTP